MASCSLQFHDIFPFFQNYVIFPNFGIPITATETKFASNNKQIPSGRRDLKSIGSCAILVTGFAENIYTNFLHHLPYLYGYAKLTFGSYMVHGVMDLFNIML